MNFVKLLRTPFLQNTTERLSLKRLGSFLTISDEIILMILSETVNLIRKTSAIFVNKTALQSTNDYKLVSL